MLSLLVVALIQAAAGAPTVQNTEPAPASVAEAPALPESAPTEEAAGGDRIVCERVVFTGSSLPRRVCMTVAEREAMREGTQRNLRRHQAAPPPDPRLIR